MSLGFGLDLAGLSNPRGTVLASIRTEDDRADVKILQSSPFGMKLSGSFEDRLERETITLNRLLRIGNVAVDVPIDLQGLPTIKAKEAWQLTLRPIDKELGALPPLASWLGACVARFNAVLTEEHWGQLGTRLFETYPKASLVQIFGKYSEAIKSYKLADANRKDIAEQARRSLMQGLKISSEETLSHDELDAVVCAVASVATDNEVVSQHCLSAGFELPVGYRIFRKVRFREIKVTHVPYNEGLQQFGV